MALTLQSTADRFAKSTQHLLSHYKQSINAFAGEKKEDTKDGDLTAEEIAIRCQINFQRLLCKTLELVENPSALLPNPHLSPLRLRVEQQYKALESDYEELMGLKRNKKVKNINFDLMPHHESKMEIIKEWIEEQRQSIDDNNRKEAEELRQREEMKRNGMKNNVRKKKRYQTHWKLRNRKRVMRFSEKLMKENQEKLIKNKDGKIRKKDKKLDEVSERDELVRELQGMTQLLKKGVTDLSDTLKKDEEVVKSLDDETISSLDKVSALNSRLKKYVESTSGMTCTMCLMMATVVFTSIWAFIAIYFV